VKIYYLYTKDKCKTLVGGGLMNILIAGGTGFIGQKLINLLNSQGYHIYILTRAPQLYDNNENKTYIGYDDPIETLPDFYAIINLAGDSLYGYWTKKKKEAIRFSRIKTTQTLINYMKQMKKKPNVFINSSAVGYYGTSDEIIFTEKTIPPGDDFLANVVIKWEETAKQAERLGIRTVYTRFGVVLGREGGALPIMTIPVKLFAGGKIGSGEQWISWIHIQDAVDIITFCMNHKQVKGPVNVTSPNPVRNKDFMKTLAKVIKRPYWFPTPLPLVRLAIGEMSDLITKGQFVLPRKVESFHFEFSYPKLEDALKEINP